MFVILFVVFSQLIMILATIGYLFTGVDCTWHVDRLFVQLLGITIYKHNRSYAVAKETKIILANHRSFTDFFLDSYLIGFASHLSRWFVGLALPGIGLYGWISGRGLFFRRGKTDYRQLGDLINKQFSFRSAPLVMYPEGQRNTLPAPLSLKHGGLKMCFEQGWPIQLSITQGKDKVIDEKKWSMNFNVPCYWILSRVLSPKDYDCFEKFYDATTHEWLKLWSLAYHGNQQSFERYQHVGVNLKMNISRRWIMSWGVLFLVYLVYHRVVSL